MNIPPDLKAKLDNIARKFEPYARTGTHPYGMVLEAAKDKASKFDCEDLREVDADEGGVYATAINPSFKAMDILDGPLLDEWTGILRKSDPGFNRLCQEYIDLIVNDPRVSMDEDEAFYELEAALIKHFWEKIDTIDGDELNDLYEEMRGDCADEEEEERYRRYDRRYASRTLTAADRSALIRLASTMPVGSTERRAILAGLSKSALTAGTVRAFLAVASSKLTQFDQRLEAKQPNPYRLGHYLKALNNVRDDVKDVLDDDSPEALGRLRASFDQRFHNLPPINATIKQIDQFLASGKMPRLR